MDILEKEHIPLFLKHKKQIITNIYLQNALKIFISRPIIHNFTIKELIEQFPKIFGLVDSKYILSKKEVNIFYNACQSTIIDQTSFSADIKNLTSKF